MYQHLVTVIAASLAMAPGAQGTTTALPSHPVLDSGSTKLVPGAQDRFIALFDKEFVESQETLGMRLVGQFHDHDRRDRFTWLREFRTWRIARGCFGILFRPGMGPVQGCREPHAR